MLAQHAVHASQQADLFGMDDASAYMQDYDVMFSRELLGIPDGTDWLPKPTSSPPPLLDAFAPPFAASEALLFNNRLVPDLAQQGATPRLHAATLDAAGFALQFYDVPTPHSNSAQDTVRTASTEMPSAESAWRSTPNCGGSGSGPSVGNGGTAASAQLAKSKEKNRAAQQQYRARQRKRQAESEQRIEELTRQLEELKTKQAEMQNREAVYDRLLASQRLGPPLPPALLGAGSTSSSNSGGLPVAQPRRGGGSDDELVPPHCAIWCSPEFAKAAFGAAELRKLRTEVLTFTAGGGAPVQMTREQITHLGPEEFGNMWQDLINELAACLLQAHEDIQSPSGQRLLQLCSEARNLRKTVDVFRPDVLAEYSRQAEAKHGVPPADLWRSIAASLTLTETQRKDCSALLDAAAGHVDARVRRRAELASAFATVSSSSKGASNTTALFHYNYFEAVSAVSQAHFVLQEESCLQTQVCVKLYGNILTSLQVAHCHVLAFPYELRPLVLLDAIVAVHPASAPPALEGAQHTAVGTLADAAPAAAGAAVELHTPLGAER